MTTSEDDNKYEVSVNVYLVHPTTGSRFNLNSTYNIEFTEFSQLDDLQRAVNDAVRRFIPSE